jgi:hypothetical protein
MAHLTSNELADFIVDYLEENRYPTKMLTFVWKTMFNELEDFPENPRDSIDFILDEVYSSEFKTLTKIYKKILKEENDE